MNELLLPLLVAAIPLAALPSMVGPILIWRRISFLSDVIAHAGILAFGCGVFFHIPPVISALCVMSIVMLGLELRPNIIPNDAWLSAISSLCVALGLLFVASENMNHIFYGDLLNITFSESLFLCVITVFVGAHIRVFWKSILLEICSPELSFLRNGGRRYLSVVLKLLYGVSITLCLKWIGVLLTSALFVLPGVFMRFVSKSPHQQIFTTFCILLFGIECGICLSFGMNLLVAPSIVLSVLAVSFLMIFFKGLKSFLIQK
jgi:ABC-type Mn2+/Zn2+ transport system permease subunit